MTRPLVQSALLLALAASPTAQAAPPAAPDAVRAELAREAAAWNHGDLDGYLSGYERAATTVFVGASRVYRGWEAIAAMYRQHYADRRRMGTLAFDELEVRPLGPGYALAVGRWHLARRAADGGPVGGFFTLTLHQGPAGWRIIVDHTTAGS